MRRNVLLAVALVAGVVTAYLPALEAGFIWNDDTYLTGNRTLDGLDGLRLIWTEPKANEQYYPMVFTSFWVEKRLFSLRPFGYHLVNVLLHAGSALLLWGLLARLRLPGAWLAAAAFAFHPLCVESVAWITERKNTLSLLLSLLAIHAWYALLESRAKAGEARKKGRAGPRNPWYRRNGTLYGVALSFFVLALFAKTTASAVPFVLLVLAWWRNGRIGAADLKPLAPFFAVGAGLALHTAWLERTSVLAIGKEWDFGLPARVALAGQVAAFYAGKIVFPSGLSFVYERWRLDPRVLSQWIPAAAAVVLTLAAWFFRRRSGRAPLAGLLLFFGVLFPAMGFFNVYPMRFSWVADHFAYQAVAVFAACAVCGVASWAAAWGPAPRRTAAVLAMAVITLFGVLTTRHSRTFRDEEILWRSTLERNAGCFVCHTNYGIWLMEKGRDAEAAEHLEASLRLKPDEVPTLLNLAQIEGRRGRLDAAVASLRSALSIDPANTVALINLATADARAGRMDEAIASYRAALRLGSPGDYLAHNGLGAALMQRGGAANAADAAEAIEHFREAVRLRPDYEHARENLERALKWYPRRDSNPRSPP